MKLLEFVKVSALCAVLALLCLQPMHIAAQSSRVITTSPAITLDPPTGLDLQAHTFDSKDNRLPRQAPANFRRLGEARVGEVADLHTLTLALQPDHPHYRHLHQQRFPDRAGWKLRGCR